MKISFSLIFICCMALISCTGAKQTLPYFENLKDVNSGKLGHSDFNIRIVPDDELLITVNSENPEATYQYNLPLTNPGGTTISENIKNVSTQQQIQTYIVNKQGDITFPILGKIHVEGMTMDDLAEYLTKRISQDVNNPIVRVSMANFKVNVLGEVKEPQTILVKSERFSVLDALAGAGDMTEYGLRDNVIVIRELPGGEKEFRRLNLQDASVVTDPYFYLQQNDVVYVEPNSIRKSNSKYNQNNSFKLSVISTIVSAISVIASLTIALTK